MFVTFSRSLGFIALLLHGGSSFSNLITLFYE